MERSPVGLTPVLPALPAIFCFCVCKHPVPSSWNILYTCPSGYLALIIHPSFSSWLEHHFLSTAFFGRYPSLGETALCWDQCQNTDHICVHHCISAPVFFTVVEVPWSQELYFSCPPHSPSGVYVVWHLMAQNKLELQKMLLACVLFFFN